MLFNSCKCVILPVVSELDQINNEILKCPICPIGKLGKCVVGEGSLSPTIVFVGEAPGKTEAKLGRPFVGRSGTLLHNLIDETGINKSQIYITSVVKYLPVSGTPTQADILHGKIHLQKQIHALNPKLVVLLGKTATHALVSDRIAVSRMHGNFITEGERKYFLTVHPAAALRFGKYRDILEKDFFILKHNVD